MTPLNKLTGLCVSRSHNNKHLNGGKNSNWEGDLYCFWNVSNVISFVSGFKKVYIVLAFCYFNMLFLNM